MKTKFNGFLTLILALVVQITFAQEKNITGTVVDENGAPLLGATVLVVNTNRATSTDFDGNYSISAAQGENIEVSYVGYETYSFTVGTADNYNISLKTGGEVLEAAVVVGYGSARSISSVAGQIANVSGEKLANRPSPNVMEALQGQVAGLQVFTSSGEPTAVSSIRLHGVGSLTISNEPLYILDGAPIAQATLLTLNSNDFESVTILKDAVATSVYGSRAANGVVYITSKKGKSGEGRINLSYEYGISELARKNKLNLMDATELLNYNLEHGIISQGFYDERMASGVNTNWEKYYYRDNAPTKKVDISMSGGNDKTTYFISGNYLDQEGITLNSEYERFNIRTNIDTEIKDWLKAGIYLSGGTDRRKSFPYGSNQTAGSLGVHMNQPYWTPYDEDGNVYDVIPGMSTSNEYAISKQPGHTRNNQFNGTFFLEMDLMKGLKFKSQYAIDLISRRGSSKLLPSYYTDLNNEGIGRNSQSYLQQFNHTITNTLEYQFNIDNEHNFSVLAGQEGIDNDYETFSFASRGMNDDRLMEWSAGDISKAEGNDAGMTTSQYTFLSFFGQANYNYLGKYFLDLSIRSDESSRFGRRNRRANFWSVGGMWSLTKEDFMQNVSFVNDLRVRASYGTTGNAALPDYEHLALVGPGGLIYNSNPGWRITKSGNPDLGWEKQTKLTAGFASSLFNNKLTLDVDFYLRKTKDMLFNVPQPYTSGFSTVFQNIGSLENRGVDVTIGATLFQNQDWNVGFTKTFNYNDLKVTGLFHGLDEWIVPNTGVAYFIGKGVDFYYPKWLGVDPADGLQMWEDPTTGEATKEFSDNLAQALKGKPRYAPIQGGFSLNASWSKGLSFVADFAYMYDNYIMNNDRFFYQNPALFPGYNQSATILNEWKEPGDQTNIPKYGEVMEFDSRLIEDASFLRLKNIAISYDIPKKLLGENNPVQSIRFTLSARNLFTITNYTGLDPEIDSNIAMGQYPNTKQYVASVRVSF